MKKVSVREVRTKFVSYVERAGRGERVVIHRYNEPVAELRGIAPPRTEPRPIGPVAGRPTFDLLPSFFEPMGVGDSQTWEAPAAGASYPPQTTAAKRSAPAQRPAPRRPKQRRS